MRSKVLLNYGLRKKGKTSGALRKTALTAIIQAFSCYFGIPFDVGFS